MVIILTNSQNILDFSFQCFTYIPNNNYKRFQINARNKIKIISTTALNL